MSENEALVIPHELLDARDRLIPSYRCAAANRLCEYIHSKQDAATKRALLVACKLDSYGMIPVNIDYLLHPGKDLTFLSELVTKNPNIVFDSLDNGSAKLLHIAIQCNNLPAVEMLSVYSVNIANKDGDTALICAAYDNNLKKVKALLAHKADPDVQDNEGSTALSFARANKNQEIIDALQSALQKS